MEFASFVFQVPYLEATMSGRDLLAAMPMLMPLVDGVRIGEIVGISGVDARPLVTYPGQPGSAALVARTVPDVRGEDIGREILLAFEANDPALPIIIGYLRADSPRTDETLAHVEAETDGQRLVVTARRELVLRCGEASITLTRAGKVLISGTYVSSRSTGVNRIKGGAVHIN